METGRGNFAGAGYLANRFWPLQEADLMIADAENEDFRALCMAVGFIVLNWALAEQQIDILVNIAFRHAGGRTIRKDGDIPRSLNQKIRFLDKCFTDLELFKPFAKDGCALLRRVSDLSYKRHDLVHGALENLEHVNGAFQFKKIKYEKDGHSVASFTFSPDDFSKFETSLGDLLTELITFSLRLGDKFPE